MSELTELRQRLQDAQHERDEFRDKFQQLEITVGHLTKSLGEREQELNDLKVHLNNNQKNGLEPVEHHHLSEYEALKKAITELMCQNEDKDNKIDELRKAVATYQKVEEIILSSQSPRRKSADTDTLHSTTLNSTTVSRLQSERGNHSGTDSAPPVPKRGVTVQRSNSYDAFKFNRIIGSEEDVPDDCESLTVSAAIVPTDNSENLTVENMKHKASCTSLPRDYGNRVDMTSLSPISAKNPNEPEICADDEDIIRKEQKKRNGLKRFFARMRRSTSQEVVAGDDNPFRRGGVRSTAGPRLGGGGSHMNNNRYKPAKSDSFLTPFNSWNSEQVLVWLHDIGLSMYINECRKWCKSGQHMLEASYSEISKEMKIHNALHKKKLSLALQGMRSGNTKDQILLGGLRTDFVTKWLDDIGLPQYKDTFYEARIDGRMLNHMTVDDLLYMKINNTLHHMSIRRGIEVLRTHNFNLGTLKRRPSLERTSNFPSSTMNGSALKADSKERDVSLWTNHRVMEWLRMIDLSEYAANLRGSGVHGALMILEPRFTVEHLANILIIPTTKTLLRRHLSGHFVNLVGQHIQTKKREVEQTPGMTLTLSMKVKPKKTNPFRRGRPVSEYICPIEKLELIDLSPASDDLRVKNAVALYKKELSKRELKRESKSKSTSN